MKALKYITLLLSYLTLSPLLLILDRKWQLLPKWLRITLFVLSPCTLIVTLVVAGLFELAIYNYIHYHRFTSNNAMERFTGVDFPSYTLTSFKPRQSHIVTFTFMQFEFNETPDSTFFNKLENSTCISEIDENGKMCFSKDYCYPGLILFLGQNGLIVHGTAYLEIKKNNSVFEISLLEHPD